MRRKTSRPLASAKHADGFCLDVAAESGKHDFETYATTLLDSVVTNSPELVHNPGLSPTLEATRSPELMEAPPALRPEMSSHRGGGAAAVALNGEGFGVDVDEANGCKAAVEIVSRNSQKGALCWTRLILLVR